jgi:16S rRNA G966 N2-methylase RsmD
VLHYCLANTGEPKSQYVGIILNGLGAIHAGRNSTPRKKNKMKKQNIEQVALAALVGYEKNARTHSPEQIGMIASSISRFGFINPIIVNADNLIIAGHGRLAAAQRLGMVTVPVLRVTHLTDAERRAYTLADNQIALRSGWDDSLLQDELADLSVEFDLGQELGFDDAFLAELMADMPDDKEPTKKEKHAKLADTYIAPPFSVLDTKQQYWIDRRNLWNEVIADKGESRQYTLADEKSIMGEINNGVSILDATLAEVLCHWFAKAGFNVLDPFAGDSVFGYVAATKGLNFTGIELRKEQADLNQARLSADGLSGIYINDTSENMDVHIADESMDFIFSCPPYADLEVYSDDPKDLSNMAHDDFNKVYCNIISKLYSKLKPNRFAVITISEVRAKDGSYLGLVPMTIDAMVDSGFKFWNEIILLNSLGTLPQRCAQPMNKNRKVSRAHQNVLVFFKGKQNEINKEFGNIAIGVNLDE